MSIPGKDPVHKCHSDPGQNVTSKNTNLCCKNKYSTKRNNVTSSSNLVNTNVVLPPPTRKCVLTLDGYSYVIGKFITFSPKKISQNFFFKTAATQLKT